MNCLTKDELYHNEVEDEEACRGNDNNCLKASDVFLHGLTSEVNRNDVYHIMDTQKHMLSRFEKTNEMLLNFNVLSSTRYTSTDLDFKLHIQMLLDTKKDLDLVFKRIRVLKNKLSVMYPAAFKACTHIYEVPDDEEEDECDVKSSEKCDVKSSEKCDVKSSEKCDVKSSEKCDVKSSEKCDDAVSRHRSRSETEDIHRSSSQVCESEASIEQVIVPQTVPPNYKPLTDTS